MLPGVSFAADPRLFEYIGGTILYLGTLVGVFLLARLFFGISCASLAVVLYGLSELGLYFAGSLWPKGHPFFYVWMLYFASQWVNRSNSRYLTAAIVTWAAGMYVHMELAPAFLILPALWFFYHPPIKSGPLVVGIALVLLIWFPYLRFEHSRGFSDVRSQLFWQDYLSTDYKRSFCNPALVMQSWKKSIPTRNSDLQEPLYSTYYARFLNTETKESSPGFETGLLGNFGRALRVPGVNVMLLSFTLISLILLGSIEYFRRKSVLERPCSKIAYPFTVLSHTRDSALISGAGMMVLFLLVPWALLLYSSAKTEYLVATRFWWLWPSQVIVLAALFTFVPKNFSVPRAIILIGQIGIILLVVGNPLLLSRVVALSETGWSGVNSDEKKVVDYIAGQSLSENGTRVSVGYQTLFYGWMPRQNVLDPRIKVGLEFDLLFKFLHGVTNIDRCAEGISPNDEYRVVQSAPSATMAYPFAHDHPPKMRFEVPSDDSFYLLKKFGPYLVLRRNTVRFPSAARFRVAGSFNPIAGSGN